MHIREANDGDVPGITAIYNDAVVHTAAIWSETQVDVADRANWLADHRASGHPVLIAAQDDNDEVLGYATFGDWRAREGYRHTVEHSVYVKADQRGNGIGRALMTTLIEHARAAGYHVMVAGIESGNTTSIRLHAQLGFTNAGTLREVGIKFGTWLDLTFLQLILDDRRPDEHPGT